VSELDYDTIEGRLDLDHIDKVAVEAHIDLVADGVAFVELTPGDMTSYKFVVVASVDEHDRAIAGGRYLVAMINTSQVAYSWDGQHTRAAYVHQKWFPRDNKWSATVLAYFLNALATKLLP